MSEFEVWHENQEDWRPPLTASVHLANDEEAALRQQHGDAIDDPATLAEVTSEHLRDSLGLGGSLIEVIPRTELELLAETYQGTLTNLLEHVAAETSRRLHRKFGLISG